MDKFTKLPTLALRSTQQVNLYTRAFDNTSALTKCHYNQTSTLLSQNGRSEKLLA